MSQLFGAFGVNWTLLLAQAVNFGILLVVLRLFLYKPVMKAIEDRRVKVAKGVEDAEKAEQMLQSADTDAAARLHSAETEAEGIVAGARDEASQEKVRILKEAEARAESVARDAEARAQEVATKALRESEKEVARLAVLAAAKVMRDKHA